MWGESLPGCLPAAQVVQSWHHGLFATYPLFREFFTRWVLDVRLSYSGSAPKLQQVVSI